MDFSEKIRSLPTSPGVYLYKDAAAKVIYVGKAKNLRQRVRSYFLQGRWEDAKTGSLLREAVDLETIVVDNEAEALALEDNLIKRWKPRFNILLRDDKTYPYIRLTHERFPRVYVTRRLIQDGSEYFGPYFPAGLAYRLVHFIHKHFLIPSCRVDLNKSHLRPCLQYHIGRCLGPCVADLTTPERYGQAAQDVRFFLSGKQSDLARELRRRLEAAAAAERFEEAAGLRDLLSVMDEVQERQKMASAEGEDCDVLGCYREGERAAVNLFHLRRGRVVDRREFFWESLPTENGGPPQAAERLGPPPASPEDEAARDDAGDFAGTVLKQIYLGQNYLPGLILVPTDFPDRAPLESLLSEHRGRRLEIVVPQRGVKKAFLDLAQRNARQSFDQRFRVLKPTAAQEAEELREIAGLSEPPARIECFDISHFQGAETVASMVVWERGEIKKSAYRKFRIRDVAGVDDFRSMAEVIGRRYGRLREEGGELPSLVLVDGGLGQLHAAQAVLEELGLGAQPLAAIAKREETLFVAGQEDQPVVLEPHSPVRHLVQRIRDESHRFAVTFHRQRRERAGLRSGLLEIKGVGPATVKRLLTDFGSLEGVRSASEAELAAKLPRSQAQAVWRYFH